MRLAVGGACGLACIPRFHFSFFVTCRRCSWTTCIRNAWLLCSINVEHSLAGLTTSTWLSRPTEAFAILVGFSTIALLFAFYFDFEWHNFNKGRQSPTTITMKTLTFAETLYPETAQIHVDPQNGFTGVWGTVINEFRNDLPVAVAVLEQRQDLERKPGEVTAIHEGKDDDTSEMPPGGGCFYLAGLLGCTLTIAAFVATYAVELVAATCYCMAAGIYYYFVRTKGMHIFIKAILMVVVNALMCVDSILLTVALILTEILGWVAGLVTSIFNPSQCCAAGQAWHVYVRKVCHLSRWAFRGFHEGWALQRMFPRLEFGEHEEQVDCVLEEQPNRAEQVVVAHQMETTSNHVSTTKRLETNKV